MDISKMTLLDLQKLKFKITKEIKTRPDGFFYIIKTAVYQRFDTIEAINSIEAKSLLDYYDGDNGLAECFTDNKSFKSNGYYTVYYLTDKTKIPNKYGDYTK